MFCVYVGGKGFVCVIYKVCVVCLQASEPKAPACEELDTQRRHLQQRLPVCSSQPRVSELYGLMRINVDTHTGAVTLL